VLRIETLTINRLIGLVHFAILHPRLSSTFFKKKKNQGCNVKIWRSNGQKTT